MKVEDLVEKVRKEPMNEHSLKKILHEYGISVPRSLLCDHLPEKLELRYPIVLKVSSEEILHKTEAGGVITGIGDRKELESQFNKIKEKFPGSGILVEEMVIGGIEIIVGVARDRSFGLAIMLGMGGIYTELYHDITFRLIPIDSSDASDMIDEVAIGKFTKGFRGQTVDRSSLVNFLVKISDFAGLMNDFLDQLDMNPVKVDGKKIYVLDSKIIKL